MDTKKLTILALLSTLAYLAVMAMPRIAFIPTANFLSYEPKDIVLVIGGFLFGPLAVFTMSVPVSFLEMITISGTGWIGFVMNVLSTCSFACTAAVIYKKNRNLNGAVVGLAVGVLVVVIVMLLWNYFLTPIFQGWPRSAVVALLIPAFLPFNLIKYGLNAAIVMLVYKPISNALRKARLMPSPDSGKAAQGNVNTGVVLLSCFVIATCVLFILVLQRRI